MTQNGWDEVYKHEKRRVEVFKMGHDEFLDENGKFGDFQLQCGEVCSKTLGEAKKELTEFVEKVIKEAMAEYSAYKDLHQAGIAKENKLPNLNRPNGLFDSFKKIHIVTAPSPPWTLKAKCPKLKCS